MLRVLREDLQRSQDASQYQRQTAEDERERLGVFGPEGQQSDAKVAHKVDAQRQERHQRPEQRSLPGEMWQPTSPAPAPHRPQHSFHPHEALAQVVGKVVARSACRNISKQVAVRTSSSMRRVNDGRLNASVSAATRYQTISLMVNPLSTWPAQSERCRP